MPDPDLEFKPRAEWKKNCSVTRGRTAGGQIRWKGAAEAGDRFLLILERARGTPDHVKKTRTVVGTTGDAARALAEMQADVDGTDPTAPAETAPGRRPTAPPPSSPSPPAPAGRRRVRAVAPPLERRLLRVEADMARLRRLERSPWPLAAAFLAGALAALGLARLTGRRSSPGRGP